ncbi:MAG TPA: tripartite tricarboxylate transporter substrate binding protein [Xanthobacteraceae bacterium]|nr:tripartite tricarboxylate transporter substrate binding protein [Xanthobacteraceae bacterium]
MAPNRRRFLRLGAALAAASTLARPALAQSWPARPIRFVIPFPAGGSTDIIGRIMAQWLTERLGQTVIVENKPGGGTNIAVQSVAHAAPDGYTLLFTVVTNTINPSLYKSLPFDFQRDILPVAGLAELPLVMDVTPSLPAKTLAEFIAYAKANPGQVRFASFGARTISHLAIELLKLQTGIDVLHVPYLGGAPMVTDLLAGRVQAGIDALPNSLPHIRSGGVRALGLLSVKRSAVLPDLPTIGETLPGFEVTTWSGLGAPAGTPDEVIERLAREVNAGLADAGVQKRFAEVGAVPLHYAPAEMRAMIARDQEKWARVVRLAGIEPQ